MYRQRSDRSTDHRLSRYNELRAGIIGKRQVVGASCINSGTIPRNGIGFETTRSQKRTIEASFDFSSEHGSIREQCEFPH